MLYDIKLIRRYQLHINYTHNKTRTILPSPYVDTCRTYKCLHVYPYVDCKQKLTCQPMDTGCHMLTIAIEWSTFGRRPKKSPPSNGLRLPMALAFLFFSRDSLHPRMPSLFPNDPSHVIDYTGHSLPCFGNEPLLNPYLYP